MPTFQYIHPSCNMKEEAEFTHFQRSVDTNTFNPMVQNLKSNLVPLTFNFNAEIDYPLGMCDNRLLQIGPIREDHREEQFWNNVQIRKRYPKKYNKEHTEKMSQLRKDQCDYGGRRGCTTTENIKYPDFTFSGVDRSLADVPGAVSGPIAKISGNINNHII